MDLLFMCKSWTRSWNLLSATISKWIAIWMKLTSRSLKRLFKTWYWSKRILFFHWKEEGKHTRKENCVLVSFLIRWKKQTKIQDRYRFSRDGLWQSKSATTQHFRNLQITSADLGRRFQFRDHLHLCFEENNKQRVDREVHEPTWWVSHKRPKTLPRHTVPGHPIYRVKFLSKLTHLSSWDSKHIGWNQFVNKYNPCHQYLLAISNW